MSLQYRTLPVIGVDAVGTSIVAVNSDTIVEATTPRVRSLLGRSMRLGRSPQDQLHERARAAAKDFDGCVDTGILPPDRVDTIRGKINEFVTQEQNYNEMNKGLSNRGDREKCFQALTHHVQELEQLMQAASTECQLRDSIGQSNYQDEMEDVSTSTRSQAVAGHPGNPAMTHVFNQRNGPVMNFTGPITNLVPNTSTMRPKYRTRPVIGMNPAHGTVVVPVNSDIVTIRAVEATAQRIVSLFGFTTAGSARKLVQQLNLRSQAAAKDFQCCRASTLLPEDRMQAIEQLMLRVNKIQIDTLGCKGGFFNKKRRALLKDFEDGVTQLEVYTQSATTSTQMTAALQEEIQKPSEALVNACLEMEAAATEQGVNPTLFVQAMPGIFRQYIENNKLAVPGPVQHFSGPVTINMAPSGPEEPPSSIDETSASQEHHVDEAVGPSSSADIPDAPAVEHLEGKYMNMLRAASHSDCCTQCGRAPALAPQ